MVEPLPVLINRSSAAAAAMGARLSDTIAEAFAETGRPIILELLDAEEIAPAVARHRGAPVIAVGGGDGTVGAAAAALANSLSALAILPLGASNQLAGQLGVPRELAAAARSSVQGQRRRVDLGIAGERVFLNHAAFGLYTRLLRGPEAGRGSRWDDTLRTAWHVLANMRAQNFALRIDGAKSALATPLLFIGNNEYAMRSHRSSARESLSEHQLALYTVARKGPSDLLVLTLRALVGLIRPPRAFLEYGSASDVVIEGDGVIEGSFDGAVALMPLPLRLRTLANALGVVTPRESADAERTLTHIH